MSMCDSLATSHFHPSFWIFASTERPRTMFFIQSEPPPAQSPRYSWRPNKRLGASCRQPPWPPRLQLPAPTRTTTTATTAATATADHGQQTALLRVTKGKREGGHTRCARSVFYDCFLLTSYYRRRGIPSISMPGPLSPSFTPVSTPRPSLPLDHSRFDVARRINPSSSCRNQTRQTWGTGMGLGRVTSTRPVPIPAYPRGFANP